jgi:transposase-like protein
VCEEIDVRIKAFLKLPIEGRCPYSWLDPTCLKVRESGRIIGRAVMVAVGVNLEGRRELLGIATGPSEGATLWTDLLRSRADRGPRGVKLVVADDHKGLRAAARRAFSATHQWCRVNWTRNILAHVGARNRVAAAAMSRTIFAPEDKTAAVEPWDEVAGPLRAKHPRIGERMGASREDVLACMSCPKEHWPEIALTNPLERLNRAIKRRADVIGIFGDGDAIVRLFGALMLEASDEWAVSRRHMVLRTLACIEQAGDVRLPAVAT